MKPDTQHLSTRRGFTMIEIMIVVGIIALLMAIVIPSATRLVDNSRASTTRSTMQVLEKAIEAFQSDNALKNEYYGTLPPDDYALRQEYYRDSTTGSLNNDRWDPTELIIDSSGTDADFNSNGRYDSGCLSCDISGVATGVLPSGAAASPGGLGRMVNGNLELVAPPAPDANPDAAIEMNNPVPGVNASIMYNQDFRSIEAMYLYITLLSPSGKRILDGLPASAIGNKDTCDGGRACPDVLVIGRQNPDPAQSDYYRALLSGKRVELNEVYDAWGRPLRYNIQRVILPGSTSKLEWELRSAGSDGRFARAFSDENTSDDVVLRGQ